MDITVPPKCVLHQKEREKLQAQHAVEVNINLCLHLQPQDLKDHTYLLLSEKGSPLPEKQKREETATPASK